jgi:glycosyltransferase involved in cell wall biosynthesis
MSKPLLTIITPCLNRAAFIATAIESVLQQDYPHVEHIIVDGGSTDGTLDVLRRYPHLVVISEPDDGLYDAINKGIARAQGTVIGHLNSDDAYMPNVFAAVIEKFAENPLVDSVCGGVEMTDAHGHTQGVINDSAIKVLRLWDATIGVPITNARFFHRRVYERAGVYKPQYRIAADREFLLRAWNRGMRTEALDPLVYRYYQHEGSLTFNPQASYKARKLPEYMAIARQFMIAPDTRRLLKHACRAWHSWEAGYQASQCFRARAFREAWRFMLEGLLWDAGWWWRFPWQLVCRWVSKCHR